MSDELQVALDLLRKHVAGACGGNQGAAIRQNAPLYLALLTVEQALDLAIHKLRTGAA